MKRHVTLVLAVALMSISCGSDTRARSTPATTETERAIQSTVRYPPDDPEGMAELIDPLIVDLGLRFTYGSLIDRSTTGSFRPSSTGDHLAIYVEPVDESYTDADYVTNTWILAQRLTPFLFDTYHGLESYDICQEPLTSENSQDRPPPRTQLDIFRGPAADIDWKNGSLADLIESSRDRPSTTTLRLDDRLRQQPAFVEALRSVEG